MILFLRNEQNQTILDLDVWIKTEESNSFVEISSSIDISNYSKMLIKNTDKIIQNQMIKDFYELSELRGWLWEIFFMGRKNDPNEFNLVVKELKTILKTVAERYDLFLVED